MLSEFPPLVAILWLAVSCLKINAEDMIDFGLEYSEEVSSQRNYFDQTLARYSTNNTYIQVAVEGDIELQLSVRRKKLTFYDNEGIQQVGFSLLYNSSVPLLIMYGMDSPHEIGLPKRSPCFLPAAVNANETLLVDMEPVQLGLSYLRFWIYEAKDDGASDFQSLTLDSSTLGPNLEDITVSPTALKNVTVLGFPVIVLRGKGIVQLIFRIIVVSTVTLFTFTMGCELDPQIMKAYLRRPIGPAIGFCCQFLIMPAVAFTIAYFVPIRQEFGFGLLTIGCSPGGGASNAWSLMLGGDINLSIMMTFISSFSALFMMPLLLFAFGRFFIDVNRVQIPYGNICLQLLQIALPALGGLFLRWWKPAIGKLLTKLTRPMFLFFILFFLTFGIYANWSIFRLLGTYPIVMPTGALLPWVGFILAALTTFIIRQPRPVIITVALETGIQNIGAAVLVLLYSMPQPSGDLGAIMPIVVSIFTPFPLYFILLGLTIQRRCCKRPPRPSEEDDITEKKTKIPASNDNADVVDCLLNSDKAETRL